MMDDAVICQMKSSGNDLDYFCIDLLLFCLFVCGGGAVAVLVCCLSCCQSDRLDSHQICTKYLTVAIDSRWQQTYSFLVRS